MLYAIVAVLALILDQAVKYWTTANIVLNTGEKSFIPGFLSLANIHNEGAAFSIMEGQRWFFVVLCVVFVAGVIYMLAKNHIRSAPARWTAVLVMAGAVGNCIDRIINGYVVDMFVFDFPIFGRSFPVFNVADIFITVGGVIFCVFYLLEPSEDSSAPAKSGASFALPELGKLFHKSASTKVRLPDFPLEPQGDVFDLDPNDPFAEWERIAAKDSKSAPEAEAAPAEMPDEAETLSVETVEEAAPAVSAALSMPEEVEEEHEAEVHAESRSEPLPFPTEIHVQEIRSEQEAAARPVSEALPTRPAAQELEEEISFNLDDILAEFRDL